jgi:hypothetical protein
VSVVFKVLFHTCYNIIYYIYDIKEERHTERETKWEREREQEKERQRERERERERGGGGWVVGVGAGLLNILISIINVLLQIYKHKYNCK